MHGNQFFHDFCHAELTLGLVFLKTDMFAIGCFYKNLLCLSVFWLVSQKLTKCRNMRKSEKLIENWTSENATGANGSKGFLFLWWKSKKYTIEKTPAHQHWHQSVNASFYSFGGAPHCRKSHWGHSKTWFFRYRPSKIMIFTKLENSSFV